ncbi:MAG: phosphonate transporter [Deltaproteobacteria bacterium]|nr:phosphonate transporter [Deltaproteobacteria bacterium]
MDDAELDQLDFGVIRMSPEARVVGYNHYESRAAGLGKDRVLGRHFFTEVAPCTNNYLVSGRFDDAALDETLPYVFTLRMRPTPVKLRLLKQPGAPYQYVLVLRGGS